MGVNYILEKTGKTRKGNLAYFKFLLKPCVVLHFFGFILFYFFKFNLTLQIILFHFLASASLSIQ